MAEGAPRGERRGMDKGARLSDCRRYRYVLWRIWNKSQKPLLFVGLNPSTADELHDDATIRRCISFAKDWAYGAIYMANLFAYRSRDPKALEKVEDPVGRENNSWIRTLSYECEATIACWGTKGAIMDRDIEVYGILKNPQALGVTTAGHPKHPLYLPRSTRPQPFQIRRTLSQSKPNKPLNKEVLWR